MKYCDRCREEFADHLNFCAHCGRPLKRAAEGEKQDVQKYQWE